MRIRKLTEKNLIQAIRENFSQKMEDLLLGIGDDAAVIEAGGKKFAITKDLLIEDYHFRASLNPPYFLGRKSLSVNLSDIAAMGGRGKYALLGLSFPASISKQWVEDFFSGFESAAKEYGVALIGGDISEAKKIMISVSVLGEVKNIITRRGAQPGDEIFVSGTLGNAKAGMILLEKKHKLGREESVDFLLMAFLDPVPQLGLGEALAQESLASAMIDISDGLSVDLHHLCEESGCGAELELRKIPISEQLFVSHKKAHDFALHGGEDYQLLFTVSPQKLKSVLELRERFVVTSIGRMIPGKRIYIIDKKGKRKLVKEMGYQHFSKLRKT